MGLRSAEKSFTYELGYQEVFEEAKNALSDCEFIIKKIDEPSGIIKAFAEVSIWSYGEVITITVSKSAEGTQVKAHSKAKAAIFDWGKSGRNVTNFFAILDKRLANSTKRAKSSAGYFE